MRIIKETFLKQKVMEYPKAEKYLKEWIRNVRRAQWHHLAEVRSTYPRTDMAKVKSGNVVFIFDVCGNDYRLIVALHFDRQLAYMLRFLTHAQYSKDTWKNEL